jgi:hypothetical protein
MYILCLAVIAKFSIVNSRKVHDGHVNPDRLDHFEHLETFPKFNFRACVLLNTRRPNEALRSFFEKSTTNSSDDLNVQVTEKEVMRASFSGAILRPNSQLKQHCEQLLDLPNCGASSRPQVSINQKKSLFFWVPSLNTYKQLHPVSPAPMGEVEGIPHEMSWSSGLQVPCMVWPLAETKLSAPNPSLFDIGAYFMSAHVEVDGLEPGETADILYHALPEVSC